MRPSLSANARKDHLDVIAQKQHGYFTANQAVKTGYTTSNHQYHLDRGYWLKISMGLFRLPGCPNSMESEFTKWCLWSRNQKDQPQGVISHDSALAYFGFGEYNPKAIHLTVPLRFRKNLPVEVVLHKASINLSDLEGKEGFMVTRLPKTLEDLRAFLSERGSWKATVENFFETGKLSREEYLQLGFAPEYISLGSVVGGDVHSLVITGTDSGASENSSRQNTPPGIRENMADKGENETRLGAPELMRERIYNMIFQRTQIANHSSRRRAQAGFTLVELLVVITIISVLASLLLPALAKAQMAARGIICASNEKMLHLGITMYLGDYSDLLPPNAAGASTAYVYSIYKYLDKPGNGTPHACAPGGVVLLPKPGGLLVCPTISKVSDSLCWPTGTAAASLWFSNYGATRGPNNDRCGGWLSDAIPGWTIRSFNTVKDGSVLFAEIGYSAVSSWGGGVNDIWYLYYAQRGDYNSKAAPSWKHNNHSANFAFKDGHVTSYRYATVNFNSDYIPLQ